MFRIRPFLRRIYGHFPPHLLEKPILGRLRREEPKGEKILKLDVYHTLLIGITQAFLGSYVMLLIDFRKPVSRWRTRWIAIASVIVGSNLVGLLFFDFWEMYYRVGAFTVTLPYILVTIWCSSHRDFRAAFSLATGLFVGSAGTAISLLANLLLWDNDYFTLAMRVVSFLALFFLLRRFSATYRSMLHQINHSWGILCIIPIVSFAATLYGVNRLNIANSLSAWFPIASLLIVCGCSYYLMYLFFEGVQKENDARHEVQLSVLQVSALQSRMEAVRAAENAIRTERHDLRHRLQTVAELVGRGDKEAALNFLDTAQKRLDEGKAIRWCRPPVLDAVFSSYFDQARSQDIRVEARVSLPDVLPVNEGELAIVVANALENAIQANRNLPLDRREIHCKMVGTPGIMLEISNPCAGEVFFDSRGLPIAQKEGHGLGVQSISAFCRKNGAVCQFDLTEGWFRLRLVL